jgi:hypothetical protein
MTHLIKIILLSTTVALFFYCANQGFPPGGPEDKTPAHVISAVPAADSTHVGLDTEIVIEFSEAVIPRSCEEALFITPFAGENVKYKWRRDKTLTIIFGEPLLKDRTYIVTIGAGTKDRRNNMMEQSFTLAFSTGDVLDQGGIRGVVYGDNVEGVQIWAYDLNELETPNPAEDFPLYITQAGKDGKWALTNMALSRYRLFAIMDRDVNNKYNVEYDLLGVATRDILLDSLKSSINPMNFRIALEDTTQPMLAQASAPDERHIDLRFTEALLPDSLTFISNYTILSEMDTLPISDAGIDFYNAAVVHLTTEKQDSSKEYTARVNFASDLNYLPILADSSLATFKGSGIPDTTRPNYLTMQPKDSSNFLALDASLEFIFSKAMAPEKIQESLVVADTLGDTIPGGVKWHSLSRFIFTPTNNYNKDRFYYATLPVDSILDLSGNAISDTLFQRQFMTVNPDTFSAISGNIKDADSSGAGPFYLKANYIEKKNPRFYELSVNGEGRFEFKDMMPGRYSIEVFRDQNSDGRFSPGTAFPFQPAERFYVFPDTIEIRSRWPDEGENILLPE